MVKEEVSEATKKIVQREFNNVIRSYENSDLAIAVLYNIGQSLPKFVDLIPERLEMPEDQIKDVMNFLLLNGLIEYSNRTKESEEFDRISGKDLTQVYLTDEAKILLESEILGPYRIIDKKILDVIDTGRVMNGIDKLVDFYYSKKIEIPVEQLGLLKEQTYSDIDKIKEKEINYIRNLLNLPENEKTSGISFVSGKDPTWVDGAGRVKSLSINISIDYNSPNEALKKGFMECYAAPKSDIETNYLGKKKAFLPPSIEILNVDVNKYELTMKNIGYEWVVREGTFAYMQEAKKKMEKLTEIVNSILK